MNEAPSFSLPMEYINSCFFYRSAMTKGNIACFRTLKISENLINAEIPALLMISSHGASLRWRRRNNWYVAHRPMVTAPVVFLVSYLCRQRWRTNAPPWTSRALATAAEALCATALINKFINDITTQTLVVYKSAPWAWHDIKLVSNN